MVARAVWDGEAAGSSPATPTIYEKNNSKSITETQAQTFLDSHGC